MKSGRALCQYTASIDRVIYEQLPSEMTGPTCDAANLIAALCDQFGMSEAEQTDLRHQLHNIRERQGSSS